MFSEQWEPLGKIPFASKIDVDFSEKQLFQNQLMVKAFYREKTGWFPTQSISAGLYTQNRKHGFLNDQFRIVLKKSVNIPPCGFGKSFSGKGDELELYVIHQVRIKNQNCLLLIRKPFLEEFFFEPDQIFGWVSDTDVLGWPTSKPIYHKNGKSYLQNDSLIWMNAGNEKAWEKTTLKKIPFGATPKFRIHRTDLEFQLSWLNQLIAFLENGNRNILVEDMPLFKKNCPVNRKLKDCLSPQLLFPIQLSSFDSTMEQLKSSPKQLQQFICESRILRSKWRAIFKGKVFRLKRVQGKAERCFIQVEEGSLKKYFNKAQFAWFQPNWIKGEIK